MKLTVCLGLLNTPCGEGNMFTEKHVEVMKKRIAKHGCIYGESSYPDLSNLNVNELFQRVTTVDLSKISHRITEVFTDENKIMAHVEATGPHQHLLEVAMGNTGNTTFSIGTAEAKPVFGIRGIKQPKPEGDDFINIVSFDLITP